MSLADSAGVPWEGRHFEPTAYADDDGSAPPEVEAAIARLRSGAGSPAEVLRALAGTRLLVPLLARLGEAGTNADGLTVDKSADLAVVTVAAPDGRTALPAFTSVEAMRSWNPSARPVPTPAERVALAAAGEGEDLLILDPGSPTEFALRRTAMEALVRGLPWQPAAEDPAIRAAFEQGVEGETAVRSLDVLEGDPASRLLGPEVVLRLALAPGLDAAALEGLLGRLRERWSSSEVVAARVDSLALKLVTAAG